MHFNVPLFPVRCAQFKNYKSKHENFTLFEHDHTYTHSVMPRPGLFFPCLYTYLCVCWWSESTHSVRRKLERERTQEREFIVRLGKPKTTMCWLISLFIGGYIGCSVFCVCVCIRASVFQIFAFGALLTINYRLCQSTMKKGWCVYVIFFLALLSFDKRSISIRKP